MMPDEPNLFFYVQFVPRKFNWRHPDIKRLFSNATAYFTKGPYCHSGIIEDLNFKDFGQSIVLDATYKEGVKRIILQDRISQNDYLRADIWVLQKSIIDRDKGLTFARRMLGKKYDPFGLIQASIIAVFEFLGWKAEYTNLSLLSRWYCSEYLDASIEHSQCKKKARVITPNGLQKLYEPYICLLTTVHAKGVKNDNRYRSRNKRCGSICKSKNWTA